MIAAAATAIETASQAPLLGAALWLAAISLLTLGVIHRETLRRQLLRTVDPRPLALFRVAFTLCLALGALEIAPLNIYLYSDEGLFSSPAVVQTFGRGALTGYGDGLHEPRGFLGPRGALDFVVNGRWSLLYFWDSPAFVRVYFALFLAACACLLAGARTRLAGAVAWLLYAGMLRRNDVHWGGEQVFCSLLFLLLLARSGAAFSVDNLLRCRRLRARGRLSTPGDPGGGGGLAPTSEHPDGLAAIYRRVPIWPQALIIAQLGIIYLCGGWHKAGHVWRSGDALAVVLQLDQYARIDWRWLTPLVGAWPLRLATWSVMWWERLFPLMLLGLWLRSTARPRLRAPAPSRRARALATTCWLTLAAALVVWAVMPWSMVAVRDQNQIVRAWTLGLVAAAIAGSAVGARWLAPPRISSARVALVRGPLAPRLWLGFGLLFHTLTLALLNVGVFPLAVVSAYVLCLPAARVNALVGRAARALARWGISVPSYMCTESPVPLEDPRLPHLHRDAAATPAWALAGAGGLILAAAALATLTADGVLGADGGLRPIWWWHGAWLLVGAGIVALGWRTSLRNAIGASARIREPWAHGPPGRAAAGGVIAYHCLALVLWQTPEWPSTP